MKKLSVILLFVIGLVSMGLVGCKQHSGGVDWKVGTGDVIPDFSLKNLQGEEVSAESLRGTPYVIAVFATWCPPCKEELVQLESKVWQPLKDKGVKVLAVNYGDEDADTIARFMKEKGLTFLALVDESGSLRKALGVEMVPQSVVVDSDGKIQELHVGYTEDGIESIKNELQRLSTQITK